MQCHNNIIIMISCTQVNHKAIIIKQSLIPTVSAMSASTASTLSGRGSSRLSLSLMLPQVLLTVDQHGHGGMVPRVPHPPLIVQQARLNLNSVVASHGEGEEELGLEVVHFYRLCPFKGL